MKPLIFKDNCRFRKYTASLDWILRNLLLIQNAYEWLPQLVVTSVNDSNHSKIPLSRHYIDEAIDIRTHDFKTTGDRQIFIQYLDLYINQSPEAARKNSFLILLEYEGTDNEHIHIQPLKGTTYP